MFKKCFTLLFLSHFMFGLDSDYLNKKDVKILILIITSDDMAVYKKEIAIWRSYMHLMPMNVEAYFIRGDLDLKNQYEILGDTIYSKTIESLVPGIFNKTILSLCALEEQIVNKFDFVLRTNLSSFFILPRLVKYCQNIPNKKYFGGHWSSHLGSSFVQGSFMLFSSDIAAKLVFAAKTLLSMKEAQTIHDDVLISDIIKSNDIAINSCRVLLCETIGDFQQHLKDKISEDVFYFRCKNHSPCLRLTDELYILKFLRRRYYLNWKYNFH